MRASGWLRGTGSATLLAFAVNARGAETGPAKDHEEPVFEFRAERMELDPTLGRLKLTGHVAVAVDRYRLTSEHLELDREPGGLRVVGPGEVAFCACPAPPLTLGFRSLRLREPSDLVLEQPTVRAFGVPVLWLPYLWLRAPSRVGLLPLTVAYRGRDGFLFGSGVHVPLGTAALDVSAAGYVEGGAEVETRLTTPRTSSTVRWDYLRRGSLFADLRGATAPDANASVAWSVDALRGGRALSGPSSLEEVALRQDRAAGAAGHSDGGTIFGIGVTAAAPRGGTLSSVYAAGPELRAGFATALGASATANLDVGITTLARPDVAAITLLSQRGEVGGRAWAGPVALDLGARTRATASLEDARAGFSATTAAGAELSVPLVKRFGTEALPLAHWVTPFVSGTVGGTDTRAPTLVPALAENGALFLASGGLRSTLGEEAGSRAAASVSARAGYAAERDGRTLPLVAWNVNGRAASFAVRGEGIAVRGPESSDVLLSILRLGPEDGLFIEGRAAGARGTPPLLARLLAGGFDAPWVSWFAEPGWSLGGRVGVPWTRALTSVLDADYDATTRVLVGARGALRYRHPCGCLLATAWVGHRVGRAGVDSFVTVGLTP